MNDKTGDAYSGGGGSIYKIPPSAKNLENPSSNFWQNFLKSGKN